jgi:signal transduction histidine kinase
MAVPAIADFAAIALRGPDGSLAWGSSIHCNPTKADVAARLREYQPTFTSPTHPAAEGLLARRPMLFSVVDEVFLLSIAQDEGHLAMLRQLAPTSYIGVPLESRERLLGVLVFATTEDSNRHYIEKDLALAHEVGRRAALAVDHALLYREADEAARARDVMMSIVSHDLKNPLSTISMATSFLLEDVIPDDGTRVVERMQLAAVQRSLDRMFRLVQDLLDVNAIDAGQLSLGRRRIQPVGPIMDDVAELLRPLAAAKSIDLVVDQPAERTMIDADRDRIVQVFSNLGGNAVKFTPENGRVTIGVRLAAAIEFRVTDTGPGIAPADLPRVFDRFWQAKSTAHLGTGLGLAIAKGIVEAHGGQICVSSKVGKGTEFMFSVPAAPSGATLPETA